MKQTDIQTVVTELAQMAMKATFGDEAAMHRFAIRYQQGRRSMYSMCLSLRDLTALTTTDAMSKRGEREPEKRRNRPIDPQHQEGIRAYLTDEATSPNYILPPVTLDADTKLQFVAVSGTGDGSRVSVGMLRIPIGYRFQVADGQHRIKAIEQAIKEKGGLGADGIAVNIVQESELEKIHQDFADCAKVKPIGKSQLVLFDTRDPIRRFAKQLCEKVRFFNTRVEKVSNTVGKTSTKVYTLNHVKNACEELLIGDSGGHDRTKSAKCEKLLQGHQFDVWLERITKFFDALWRENRQTAEISRLALGDGKPSPTLRKMKEDYVLFNGTALAVVGRVGFHLIRANPALFEKGVKDLAGFDWRRKNPFWTDCLIVSGQVVNSRTSKRETAVRIIDKLRIPRIEG